MDALPFTLEEYKVKEEDRLKVRAQPVNYTLYAGYKHFASRIYNIKFKPGDVVLVSTPKAGTHWVAEMMWNIVNNVDVEAARKKIFHERVIMLERNMLDYDELMPVLRKKREAGEALKPMEDWHLDHDAVEFFENMPSPRLCFTHLPFCLLPPNMLEVCKVVFISRSPGDAVCSYWPFLKARCNVQVDFETFFEMYLEGTLLYTPFWSLVNDVCKHKGHPNLFFLLYEDMIKDLPGCIRNVSNHLKYSLSEDQVKTLTEHLSFKSMKENNSVNLSSVIGTALMSADGQLMRKGQVGGSKTGLSEEQKRRLKAWCEANRSDCSIKYPDSDL